MRNVTPVSVDLSTFVTNDGTFIYALQKEDVGDFKYMAASLKRKFKVSPREIKRFNPSAEWYTGKRPFSHRATSSFSEECIPSTQG